MKVMEASSMEFTPFGPAGIRAGSIEAKVFATGEMAPGSSFFFALMRYGVNGPPFETPRHHHNFQQVRYVLDGEHNYAPRKQLPAGWVGYFPAGAYYGPQRDEGDTVLYLQFGDGYVTEDQQQVALAEMSKTGTFNNGVYSTVDPESGKKKNKDASQAVYEFVHKRPLVYPEPRYQEPIPINPDAFGWQPFAKELSHKLLGKFTENEVTVSILRWDAKSSCTLPASESQFVFTLEEGVRIDGQSRPAQTAVWSQHGEILELDGAAGAEVFVIAVPAAD
jgi:hypothetical protein